MEEIAQVYARALFEVATEHDDIDAIREQLGQFADALDEQTVTQIGDRIGERTGRRVSVTSVVDPDILGGIVLRVGNSILDASIRTRLENLRKQVAKA